MPRRTHCEAIGIELLASRVVSVEPAKDCALWGPEAWVTKREYKLTIMWLVKLVIPLLQLRWKIVDVDNTGVSRNSVIQSHIPRASSFTDYCRKRSLLTIPSVYYCPYYVSRLRRSVHIPLKKC